MRYPCLSHTNYQCSKTCRTRAHWLARQVYCGAWAGCRLLQRFIWRQQYYCQNRTPRLSNHIHFAARWSSVLLLLLILASKALSSEVTPRFHLRPSPFRNRESALNKSASIDQKGMGPVIPKQHHNILGNVDLANGTPLAEKLLGCEAGLWTPGDIFQNRAPPQLHCPISCAGHEKVRSVTKNKLMWSELQVDDKKKQHLFVLCLAFSKSFIQIIAFCSFVALLSPDKAVNYSQKGQPKHN